MGDIILEGICFRSCKECSSSNYPIPEDCPLWKLDPDNMIESFNDTEGVHVLCPYTKNRTRYDINMELDKKWDELIKMVKENDSITSQLISSMQELSSSGSIWDSWR